MTIYLRSVERVHEDERHVGLVLLVEVLDPSAVCGQRCHGTDLDLSNGQVQERHAVTDFDDTLGTDTAHGGTETTVELENGELVEERRVDIVPDLVRADLLGLGGVDLVPVADGISLCSVASPSSSHLLALCIFRQVAVEQEEEGFHLGVEHLCGWCVSLAGGRGGRVDGPSSRPRP